MAPRSKWTDWRPGDPTPEPATSVGFVSPLTRGAGSSDPAQEEANRQNIQKGGTPLFSSPDTLGRRTDKADKTAEHSEPGDRQNRQNGTDAGVDSLDRIAELCVRHHLGQWTGTPVAHRLDDLLAAPLDELAETEAALLRACDYLGVTGDQLDAMNQQADQLAKHDRWRGDGGTNRVGSTS